MPIHNSSRKGRRCDRKQAEEVDGANDVDEAPRVTSSGVAIEVPSGEVLQYLQYLPLVTLTAPVYAYRAKGVQIATNGMQLSSMVPLIAKYGNLHSVTDHEPQAEGTDFLQYLR